MSQCVVCDATAPYTQEAISLNGLGMVKKMVGTAGFEPATTTPPVWCATRLRYAPNGAKYTGIQCVREC